MKKYDFVLIGCGLFNSVLAERISQKLNKSVLIIEKEIILRKLLFRSRSKYRIEFHKYGTHIFYTSIKE